MKEKISKKAKGPTKNMTVDKGYRSLLKNIKERIRLSQYEALKTVNKEMIGLYWDIGKMIVNKQNTEKWGKSVVEMLAKDLQNDFPGIGGFSPQNLWYMRQFYTEYYKNQKLQPLVGEIVQPKRYEQNINVI
ncbi:MAG: hypothetical protein BWY69_00897 [Planctomycetes bacterium ADurb.Bin401]|nr:MAG: hypothetical protein BWY69_00897 [Planctomycetes bacterium ADurb.Bin401]